MSYTPESLLVLVFALTPPVLLIFFRRKFEYLRCPQQVIGPLMKANYLSVHLFASFMLGIIGFYFYTDLKAISLVKIVGFMAAWSVAMVVLLKPVIRLVSLNNPSFKMWKYMRSI